MRDRDYTAAVDFLARFYEGTEHAVEIRALPNETGGGRPVFTRDPGIVDDHCKIWDKPGYGVFFAVATRITGRGTGKRADIAEVPALWVDIDCYKLSVAKESACAALNSAPLPPSVIIDSGGGIHAHWLLSEAIGARLPDIGPDTVKEDVDAALKQLAGVFAGDTVPTQIAAIMRLPGTHNTKTGDLRPVHVLEASWARYEFTDIQDMLSIQRPLLEAKERPIVGPQVAETNPFSNFAAKYGIKAPIDVDERLAAMQWQADGDRGIHATRCSVSSSLAARGVDDQIIFDLLLDATHRAVGAAGGWWDWRREERIIWEEIRSGRQKYAPGGTYRQSSIGESGQETNFQATGTDGPENVVQLDAEREARQKKTADNKSPPLISRIGDAVIDGWHELRGPIAVVEGQPHTYALGIWEAWGKGDHHALKVAIQSVVAAGGIDPKTQLLNAVYRYVIEHPSLMHENVEWDASGLVICQDGAIDPLTRATFSHSPKHWATTRAEIKLTDIGQGCPQWLAFLNSCFTDLSYTDRTAVIDTIGEWFGAALVRNKPREMRKALWLYGESRTGKTRIAEVLRLLIGEPTCSLKLRALEKNFGGSALIGTRAWIADDAIGSSDEIDDALFKVIVTGEAFQTDVKNSAHETLRLNIPVLFTSNPLPRVKDQSDAVFNRAMLIHMCVARSEAETAGSTPIDEIVKEKELAGVFSWALDGWARLSGRGRFVPPRPMIDAAAEFKSANNIVDSWAREALELSPGWMVDRRDTYASFRGWYITEFGDMAKPPSPRFVMMTLRQIMKIDKDKKLKGWPHVNGVRLTKAGAAYHKELAQMTGLGTGSGSGSGSDDLNKRTIQSDDEPPVGTEPEPIPSTAELPPTDLGDRSEISKMSKKPRF